MKTARPYSNVPKTRSRGLNLAGGQFQLARDTPGKNRNWSCSIIQYCSLADRWSGSSQMYDISLSSRYLILRDNRSASWGNVNVPVQVCILALILNASGAVDIQIFSPRTILL